MKRIVIYVLLSVILIVPIASIIVIAVLGQPESEYVEYAFSNNYDDLSTGVVEKKDLEEVISCVGRFDSNSVINQSFSYNFVNPMMCFVDIGDYVDRNTVLCSAGEAEKKAECEGRVVGILQSENEIVIQIKETPVKRLVLNIAVEKYPYINNSDVTFEYFEKQYNASYIGKCNAANEGGDTFEAYYKVNGSEFIADGQVLVDVRTGKVSKDTYTVPKKYIFFGETGKYYIEIVDSSEGIKRMYVKLGIMGKDEVEIIPLSEKDTLREGSIVNENSKDAFSQDAQDYDDNNNATKEKEDVEENE